MKLLTLALLTLAASAHAQDLAVEGPRDPVPPRAEVRIAEEAAIQDRLHERERDAQRTRQRAELAAIASAADAERAAIRARFQAELRGAGRIPLRDAVRHYVEGLRGLTRFAEQRVEAVQRHRGERDALRDAQRAEAAAQAARARWLRTNGVEPARGARATLIPVFPEREGADRDERFFELVFAPIPGVAVDVVDAPAPARLEPALFDVCETDHYFVHFADRDFATPPSGAQLDALVAEVDALAEAWWIAGPAPVREPLPIRAAAAPHAVRAIQRAAASVFGADAARVRVGRRCTFTNQAAQDPCIGVDPAPPAPFSSADEDWHLRRIAFTPDAPAGGATQIALLDSGIDPGVVAGIEHVGVGLAPAAVAGADRIHGTEMALIAQRMLGAQGAVLHSYRVFDETNTSNPHWLAAALDRAIYGEDSPVDAPLVVNLSLGWPPALSQPRALEVVGDGPIGHAAAIESGVGEAVRAVLDEAASEETVSGRRVSVVAAAGNRPRGDTTAASLRDGFGMVAGYTDDCLGKFQLDYQWFFPGEWYATPTCELDEDANLTVDPRRLTWTVSAVDSAGDPSYIASAGAGEEPPFVAPGELVVVNSADQPVTELRLPAVVTGTSASTAITTAVAAYAQALCTSGVAPGCPAGLTRWQLGHVLYFAATPTGRGSRVIDQTGPRAINWCRTRALLTCEIGDVLACLGEFPAEPSSSRIFAQSPCADLMAACAAPCGDLPEVPTPAWTDAYADWFACYDSAPTGAPEGSEVCDASPCPFEYAEVDGASQLIPDQASMGTLGPQPGSVGCTVCSTSFSVGNGVLDAYLTLNPAFGSGTVFKGASLVLAHSTGKKESLTFPPADVATWIPGDKLTIKGMTVLAPNLVNSKTKVVLHLTVDPPSGQVYDNESVVPLSIKP